MGMKKQLRPDGIILKNAYPNSLDGILLPDYRNPDAEEFMPGGIIVIGDPAVVGPLAERIRNLLALSDSCLDKLEPGEPFFVLKATDMLASGFVHDWADRAGINGARPEKIAEARQTAEAMRVYPGRRMPT